MNTNASLGARWHRRDRGIRGRLSGIETTGVDEESVAVAPAT